MSTRCSLVVNGKTVRCATGDTPLETALADGMIAATQGVHGVTALGQAALRRGRPRLRRSEAVKLPEIPERDGEGLAEVEPRAGKPALAKRAGTLTEVTRLSPRLVQAVVTLTKPLAVEPGHQVVLSPEGFAPLTLTPSLRVDGAAELNELVFHLRCGQEGAEEGFAAALANGLALGHEVKAKGPVGRGQYRPGGGRLVLVASETGFAGIWAIARAARYIEPAREIHLVVGARDPLDLYMRPALDWLKATGVSRITLVSERHRQRPPDVRPGPLTAHVPSLRTTDAVHVSGCAATVGAVEVLAAATGARCYPIPLDPNA